MLRVRVATWGGSGRCLGPPPMPRAATVQPRLLSTAGSSEMAELVVPLPAASLRTVLSACATAPTPAPARTAGAPLAAASGCAIAAAPSAAARLPALLWAAAPPPAIAATPLASKLRSPRRSSLWMVSSTDAQKLSTVITSAACSQRTARFIAGETIRPWRVRRSSLPSREPDDALLPVRSRRNGCAIAEAIQGRHVCPSCR